MASDARRERWGSAERKPRRGVDYHACTTLTKPMFTDSDRNLAKEYLIPLVSCTVTCPLREKPRMLCQLEFSVSRLPECRETNNPSPARHTSTQLLPRSCKRLGKCQGFGILKIRAAQSLTPSLDIQDSLAQRMIRKQVYKPGLPSQQDSGLELF